MKIGIQSNPAVWIPVEFIITDANNVRIVFRRKEPGNEMSGSMMQAFPHSYFFGGDNKQFQAWHDRMSRKKECRTANASNSLVKTGSIHALLVFNRWREGKESNKWCRREVKKKRKSCVSSRKLDGMKRNGRWELKEKCGSGVSGSRLCF